MLIWLSALGVLRVRRDCDFGRYATSWRDSVRDDDPNDSMTTRMLPSRYRDSFESVRGNSVEVRSLPLPLSHLEFA